MRKQLKEVRKNEQGNAILITIIILMVMAVLVGSLLNTTGAQYDVARLNRNTSNTYYIAESGIEKYVESIDNMLAAELPAIAQKIGVTYAAQLAADNYTDIEYKEVDGTNYLRVNPAQLKTQIQKELAQLIKAQYSDSGAPAYEYVVQSDRQKDNYETKVSVRLGTLGADGVTITPQTIDDTTTTFNLVATATTTPKTAPTEIYDKQTVVGSFEINIPDDLMNQIHEMYTWKYDTDVPELFDAALISFSDVALTSGTLNVTGDMKVLGNAAESQIDLATGTDIDLKSAAEKVKVADTNQSGGVIVKGGTLNVTGNLCSVSNVVATAGWGSGYAGAGQVLTVTGNVIANTLGIIDDYYEGGTNQQGYSQKASNLKIQVNGDVYVDNDVKVDRWVKSSEINVTGTIFGVSDGSDVISYSNIKGTDGQMLSNIDVVDPNSSSGVFCQGESSVINAGKVVVNGQPYLTIDSTRLPMKLYECVGEPFRGVAGWAGYETGDEKDTNASYLLSGSPLLGMIKKNQVAISNYDNSYAHYYISASGRCESGSHTTVFSSQAVAKQFFYLGGSGVSLGGIASNGAPQTIISEADSYYTGTNSTGSGFYSGKLYSGDASKYKGLRSYMTAMRSVFFNGFASQKPNKLSFEQVIGSFPADHEWSYSDPIDIGSGKTIDISKYYEEIGTEKKPYPSIIINNSDSPLVLTCSDTSKNIFNGVIISKGNISFDKPMTIKGTVIVKGGAAATSSPSNIMTGATSSIALNGNTVNLIKDSDVILKLRVKDHECYRKILNALKLTQYVESKAISEIMGPYTDGTLNYTSSKVKYSKESVLEIDSDAISTKVKSIKKQ